MFILRFFGKVLIFIIIIFILLVSLYTAGVSYLFFKDFLNFDKQMEEIEAKRSVQRQKAIDAARERERIDADPELNKLIKRW